jgi:uncharacterized protein (TIGR02996 family)
MGFVSQQSPDPRFAALLSSVASSDHSILEAQSRANEFCRALLQHADTGHAPLLASLRGAVAAKLHKALSEKNDFLEGVPSPPPGWCLLLASTPLPKSKGTTAVNDEAALWSQIYEQPENLEARAVLSDLLTERGDQRGPFIAAQLAGSTAQPPANLAGAILGPIGSALRPETVRFECGFPVSGRVSRIPARKLAVALLHREWSTLKSVDGLERLSPTLRSLASAPYLSKPGVDEWIKKRWQIPLRHVGLPFDAFDRAARVPAAIEHLTLFHLYVRPEENLDPLFESLRTIASLRTLTFAHPMLRVEKPELMFTSELGDAWPVWSEKARGLPALETMTWELQGVEFDLLSLRERLDTLRVVIGAHFKPSHVPTIVAQALKLTKATRRAQVSGPSATGLEVALRRAGFEIGKPTRRETRFGRSD